MALRFSLLPCVRSMRVYIQRPYAATCSSYMYRPVLYPACASLGHLQFSSTHPEPPLQKQFHGYQIILRNLSTSSSASKDEMVRRNMQAMKMMDFNEDGYLSFEDYEIAADNYAKHNRGVPNENMQRYLAALKKSFEFLGLGGGKKMTIKEAVEKTNENINNPEFVQLIKNLFSAVFDNLDVDCNGFLSPKEWEAYMTALKFTDPSKGKEIFNHMDLNKDGQLSREEFVEMSFEYWYSGENKHGSSGMFGNQ